MRDVGDLIEAENLLNTSAFSIPAVASSLFPFIRGGTLSLAFLFRPIYLQNPFLLFFASLVKFGSICALSFPNPSVHIWTSSLYSFQATRPCFHCQCISFSHLSLTNRFSFSHASFLSPLLHFKYMGMKISCVLRKVSLKSYHLCSFSLSLRTAAQGISLINSLIKQNSTFLKFRVLTLLFARPIFLKITNSTRA